jgi:hypothetical protein
VVDSNISCRLPDSEVNYPLFSSIQPDQTWPIKCAAVVLSRYEIDVNLITFSSYKLPIYLDYKY